MNSDQIAVHLTLLGWVPVRVGVGAILPICAWRGVMRGQLLVWWYILRGGIEHIDDVNLNMSKMDILHFDTHIMKRLPDVLTSINALNL